jgi:hypothetical protein
MEISTNFQPLFEHLLSIRRMTFNIWGTKAGQLLRWLCLRGNYLVRNEPTEKYLNVWIFLTDCIFFWKIWRYRPLGPQDFILMQETKKIFTMLVLSCLAVNQFFRKKELILKNFPQFNKLLMKLSTNIRHFGALWKQNLAWNKIFSIFKK